MVIPTFRVNFNQEPRIGFLGCYGPRSSAQALKTKLATWVSCYLPKERVLQTNDFSFLNF